MITLRTTDKPRQVKKALLGLLKSKTITEAYKISYAKHYSLTQEGGATTENVQLLVLCPTDRRDKTSASILNKTLNDRSLIDTIQTPTQK